MDENANLAMKDEGAGAHPPGSTAAPPPLLTDPARSFWSLQHLFLILLSLCLGLFMVDAIVSLLDDSLILFSGGHLFSGLREITGILTILMAVGIYVLIGLTPKVPKRLFLPVAFFILAALLAIFPFAIYCYGRLQLVALGFSVCQVILGFILLRRAQNGGKLRWLLVPEATPGARNFSSKNLVAFVALNLFVLLPAIAAYLFACSALAVGHFSAGFMALHPGGFTVQARTYVRYDGKTIELFPMAHVADADFYQNISQSFPSNSLILVEGVSDNLNLLTNKLSYQRMAKSLGLAEQKQTFKPGHGKVVRADVDVSQFTPDTITCLNLVSLIHAQGLTPANIQTLSAFSPDQKLQDELIDDILTKRNQHLLDEIETNLTQSGNIIVPWGVAHMPGTAREIQKLGFHLTEVHEYSLIRFFGHAPHYQPVKP